MPTLDENRELIDNIKRPIRHYSITLVGYGSEVVYGKSSKEEYDYWETNIDDRRREFNIPEDESPFNRYIMDKDDIGGYEDVPAVFQREGEWYDQDDIDHGSGVNFDSAWIKIIELDNEDMNSDEIDTIVEEELSIFTDNNYNDIIVGDSEAYDKSYVYSAVSNEKGIFFSGMLSTTGKINLSNLRFNCTEYLNDEVLVNSIFYGEEEVDNDGGDTNGKGLYIELLELQHNL